jgi:5-methylcytosine-specific restriction endonuclease McrA
MQLKRETMHKLNTNPISVVANIDNVAKGLHEPLKSFFSAEKDNLRSSFLHYDSLAKISLMSLVTLKALWPDKSEDADKKSKRGLAYNLYKSDRPFVNAHWEALKKANGNHVLMCPICGLEECSEMDHYIPRSSFPEYSSHVSNLIPLCHKCNHDKSESWLDDSGNRIFFNAFYDQLPAQIIECSITIDYGYPKVAVSIHKELDKSIPCNAVIVHTIGKLKLIEKFQMKADAVMRSELQRLKLDYSTQKQFYQCDRNRFWDSRVTSYKAYADCPKDFDFITIEIYKAMYMSTEMREWVVCSDDFIE